MSHSKGAIPTPHAVATPHQFVSPAQGSTGREAPAGKHQQGSCQSLGRQERTPHFKVDAVRKNPPEFPSPVVG